MNNFNEEHMNITHMFLFFSTFKIKSSLREIIELNLHKIRGRSFTNEY